MNNNGSTRVIPRIIHFVWAGGSNLLPDKSKHKINDWARLNPSFKIFLWIDSTSAPTDLSVHYREQFSNLGSRLELHDISKFSAHELYPCVRYEIDKLMPNYGASSDIVRYLGLYQYGGAYFDSDVTPNPDFSLEASGIFEPFEQESNEEPKIYFDDRSQGSNAIGNDAIICPPQHSFMKTIIESIKAKYRLNFEDNNVSLLLTQARMTYLAKNEDFFVDSTIYKTGPGLIAHLILENNLLENGRSGLLELVPPCHSMRFGDKSLTANIREPNTRLWVGVKIEDTSEDAALKRILSTIKFEAINFGILRLDDHLDDLCAATDEDSERLLGKLLNALNDVSWVPQVKMVQIESSFSQINAFYDIHGLARRTIDNLLKLEQTDVQYIVDCSRNTLCLDLLWPLLESKFLARRLGVESDPSSYCRIT